MRIGINLLPYSPNGQGGAEVYTRNLLHALASSTDQHEYVLFMNPLGARSYDFPGSFRRVVVPVDRDRQWSRAAVEQLALPILERRFGLDVLFANYVIPFTPGGPARIVNIHDMLYRRYPQYLPRSKRWWWRCAIPLSVRRSSFVLTVSRSSADDIASAFPRAASKLMVHGEGVDGPLAAQQPDEASVATTLTKYGIVPPFVLSTGGFGPQKNVNRLLEAFQLVRRSHPATSLVLTGRPEQLIASAKPALLDHVLLPGFLDVAELADLYTSAELYVLASVYEGFGLPILEAQHFGCPVATSDAAAPREVGGEAVETFDPWVVKSIGDCISQLLGDGQKRSRLAVLGRNNLQRYSWPLAAERFLAACHRAVGDSLPSPRAHPALADPGQEIRT